MRARRRPRPAPRAAARRPARHRPRADERAPPRLRRPAVRADVRRPATSPSSGSSKALPPALACAAPGWRALVLVKPQFEAGPATSARAASSATRRCSARVARTRSPRAFRPGAGASLGVADSGLRARRETASSSSTSSTTAESVGRPPHRAPVTRAAVVDPRPAGRRSGARMDVLERAAARGRRRARRPRRRRTPTSRSPSAATGRCSARSDARLGHEIPVFGVNFGRVGFLTSIAGDELETRRRARLRRRVPGRRARDARRAASTARRRTGGQRRRRRRARALGRDGRAGAGRSAARTSAIQPCDGMICATPSGSTAYNLSNGGPVIMWGLDAMAITFVAPHSLAARPLVVPRGLELRDRRTRRADVRRRRARRRPRVGELGPRASLDVGLGERPSLLALLPEVTFFRRLQRRLPLSAALASASRTSSSSARPSSRFGPGLNAVTGETGAGKTILAQAIGLLLGAQGRRRLRRARARPRPTSRPSSTSPDGLLDDAELEALAELTPGGRGRRSSRPGGSSPTGAPAPTPGAAASPREELAALVERLLAMSGQFEQRRLARPAYQLDLLDAFAGDEQLRRRAELRAGLARAHGRPAARATSSRAARLAGRERPGRARGARRPHRAASSRATRSAFAPSASGFGTRPSSPRPRPRRPRRVAPEATRRRRRAGRSRPARALASGRAARARARRGRARSCATPSSRLREAASDAARVPRLARGRARPARGGRGRARADRRREAPLRRRDLRRAPRAGRAGAQTELDGRRGRGGPGRDARSAALAEAESRRGLARASSRGRAPCAAAPFADEVAAALGGLAMGGGEFRVDARRARRPAPTGRDEVAFLIRPNAGLPFAPVAETASGGELSRIALALRTVAHAGAGEPTIVFDEIDAGIGGETAHAVAEALRTPRRARPGRHDHAPPADRERRRRALPGREGAGRPDAHAHRAPRRRRAPRGARAHARRRRVPRHPRE